MKSKPVVLRVQITELPMLVERNTKQTALSNKPEPMSLQLNKYDTDPYFLDFFQSNTVMPLAGGQDGL